MMTEDQPKSRQSKYLEKRRRESGGQVTFLPRDKKALDDAVKASGESQQKWLVAAVEEKIERDSASITKGGSDG